jgi:hypothetical protein
MAGTPFDTLESAHDYVSLLASEVDTARVDIQEDIGEAARDRAVRRLDALQVVEYKLKQLSRELRASRRILNDLRMLRRLLAAEPGPGTVAPRQLQETGSSRS